MIFLPLIALLFFLTGLLSLALLGVGGFLVISWFLGSLTGLAPLLIGAGMLLFGIAGRPLVLMLLRRPGKDEPKEAREGSAQRIKRPDGSELHVEVYGPADAQPLILTHGWGVNSTEWYYVKRALSNRFRLIMWDLPGLGKSGKPDDNNFKLEKLASDLEAVLGVAGGKPAILMGHSIGSMMTLTFCRLFPQHLGTRVSALVLAHTTYTNPVKTASLRGLLKAIQKPVLEPLMHLMVWLSPLFWLMNWMSYFNGTAHLISAITGFAGKETRGQLDYGTRMTVQASPAVLARGILAMFDFEEKATLDKINVPVLIVAGDLDRLTNPDAAAFMSQAMPAAQLTVLGPCGHMSMFEQNVGFVEALSAFSNLHGASNARAREAAAR